MSIEDLPDTPLGIRKTGLDNPEPEDYTEYYKQAWLRVTRRFETLQEVCSKQTQRIKSLNTQLDEPEFCASCSQALEGYSSWEEREK